MAAASVRSWEGIPICDPHFHYWNVHETPNPALGDLGKALPVYLRADFNRDFADLPLRAAVHVEATVGLSGDLDSTAETGFVLREGVDVPFAIVAHADLTADNAAAVLAKHATEPKVHGVRMIVNYSEELPHLCYPTLTHNVLRNPTYRHNLESLQRLGFSYDFHTTPEQLFDAAECLRSIPDTPVIVNHLACPRFHREGPHEKSNDAMWRLWREGLRAVASLPNVHIKLSNPSIPCKDFVTNPASAELCGQLVREAIDLFGIDRCMFASNFPVDGLQSGVTLPQLYEFYRVWAGERPVEDLRKLFFDNAVRVYRVDLDAVD